MICAICRAVAKGKKRNEEIRGARETERNGSRFPTGFDICPSREQGSRRLDRGGCRSARDTPLYLARHQSWEHRFGRVVDFLYFPQDLRFGLQHLLSSYGNISTSGTPDSIRDHRRFPRHSLCTGDTLAPHPALGTHRAYKTSNSLQSVLPILSIRSFELSIARFNERTRFSSLVAESYRPNGRVLVRGATANFPANER